MTKDECCPPFEPELWQNKTVTWESQWFLKARVFCLFYMPIGFGRTMTRVMSQIDRFGAKVPDWLCLSDHTSKWNMDLYVAIDREVPEAQICKLDGRYFCRVYEGPFSDTSKFCDDYSEYVKQEGMTIGKQYMWYTTCPKCAKKRGKNYIVIFGQLT